MKYLKKLGLLATGDTHSTDESFALCSDILACVPTLVVRNAKPWIKRYSALGIRPFARKAEPHTTSYACATTDGSAIIIIVCPRRSESPYFKALEECGTHFSELKFFCGSRETAEDALDVALRSIPEAKVTKTYNFNNLYYANIRPYRHMTYSFLCAQKDAVFLKDYLPYEGFGLYEDPKLGTKLDHIVQNLPEGLYRQMCVMFADLGFAATFDGADTVEFATKAFAPAGGIFDMLPFFALNTSQNATSQINVGIAQHGGPFVQHLAFHVNDYCTGAEHLTDAGISVMGLSRRAEMSEYYKKCEPLFREIFPQGNFELFVRCGGLFDHDCEGTDMPLGLLQSFFCTLDSIDLGENGRLTCFIELIQRSAHGLTEEQIAAIENFKGACAGFGKGNFAQLAADVTAHGKEINVATEL